MNINLLDLIRIGLRQILNDLDSGNSTITESEQEELLSLIEKLNAQELSKIEAANFLGISRATFDNRIKEGLIPKGKKKQGFSELIWNKSDLSKILIK